jgi:hypothetical protein
MSLENSQVLGEFVQIVVWCLGAVLLVIQIIKSFRRSPPAEQEFASKTEAAACQMRCSSYKTKNDSDNAKRDKDSSESRAKLYGLIEGLRADMDEGLRELGERLASQEAKTEMVNQRQIQMDQKIDVLLTRK